MNVKIMKSNDETSVRSTGATITASTNNWSIIGTASGLAKDSYYTVMPKNVDIFTDILKKVASLDNPQISKYVVGLINTFRNTLLHVNQYDIISNNLSKFILNTMPDKSVLIEWNFENFRIGFSVEPNVAASSYYLISDDKVTGSYKSESNLLKPEQFDKVAKRVINFVLRNT